MEYLDFDLEIAAGTGRDYPVMARNDRVGEARETMHFPFDDLQLENRLQSLQIALLRSGGNRRLALSKEEETVQNFGRDLFKSLFTGEVLVRYRLIEREAASQDKGIRIKLRIHQPHLAALPWEFLYDSDRKSYLVLSQKTPLVRYLELPRMIQPLSVTLPLRILGMVASPTDLPELDIENEKKRVERAVAGLQARGLVEWTWLEGQTSDDLQRALWHGPWHIFHFIGHGGFHARRDEGLIALCDETGKAHHFRATELAGLLADQPPLRLVFLNACDGARGSSHDIFSSTAAILVQQEIPAVLAMQYEITDRAAIKLSQFFYEALAAGLPVDTAVAEARKAMSIAVQNTIEWGTPVLYMRSPDGILFHLQSAASRDIPPSKDKAGSQTPSGADPKATPSPPASSQPPTADPDSLNDDLTRLHFLLIQAFDLEEFKTLCFQMGVDYDNLGGEGKTAKMRELLVYLDRRGEVGKLVALCEKERPKLSWRKAAGEPSTFIRRNDLSRLTAEVVTTNKPVVGSDDLSRLTAEAVTTNKPVVGSDDSSHLTTEVVTTNKPVVGSNDLSRLTAEAVTTNKPVVGSDDLSRLTTEVVTTNGYVDEKTGAVMVRIPAGAFLYGEEKEKVFLPEFWISKTPVTNAQYKKFIEANPEQPVPGHWDARTRTYPTGKADHPVVNVSWQDAVAYATWAGKRLPTEQEWEKAARGTDGREYPWGDYSPTPKLCNFDGNVGDTTPVGNYSPQGDSPYGCVDMSGNVWEWTDSWFGEQENYRVLRGGSWSLSRWLVRAVVRRGDNSDFRNSLNGFRLVIPIGSVS